MTHAGTSDGSSGSDPGAGTTTSLGDARLSVASVAHRLGVAPATLRTWARRYGLGPSRHEAGAHRRYSTDDLARLQLMRRLTLQGVPPGEAARVARQSPDPGAAAAPVQPAEQAPAGGAFGDTLRGRRRDDPHQSAATAPTPPDSAASGPATAVGVSAAVSQRPWRLAHFPAAAPAATPAAARADAAETRDSPPQPPSLRTPTTSSSSPSTDAVLRAMDHAATSLDSRAVTDLVRGHVAEHGVVGTWNTVLRPVLSAAGARWASSGEGIEIEHLLADCTITVLREVAERTASHEAGRPVLLACAPDELHALPLYAVAAGLAESGVASRVLGSAMPSRALHAAVRRTGPAVLFIWSQRPGTADPEVVESLPVTRPPVAVIVGGPGWSPTRLPDRATVATDLQHTLDLVGQAVSA